MLPHILSVSSRLCDFQASCGSPIALVLAVAIRLALLSVVNVDQSW